MAQQIEPIEIFGKENKGEYLYVFQPYPFTKSNQVIAEILDKDGYFLSSIILIDTSYEEIAEKLNLKLKQ